MSAKNSRVFISPAWTALEDRLVQELEKEKQVEPLKKAVVLVGSELLARHLERAVYFSLSQKGLGINIEFLVFPGLVEKLYYTPLIPEYKRKASDLIRFLVLKDIIGSLGEEHYFEEFRGSLGLIESLANESQDLKDGLVIGEQWQLVKKHLGGTSKRLNALFEILELLDQRLLDYESAVDRFLVAIDKVRNFKSVFGADTIFIYGFYDYTAIQMELIRALAKELNLKVFMVKPESDFFANYEERILDFYVKELKLKEEKLGANYPTPGISIFQKALTGAGGDGLENDKSLRLIFAPGIEREAKEIAREMTRLVREEGLKFEEIGVLVRDYKTYGAVLSEVFEQHKIPFYLESGKPLIGFGSVRAWLNLFKILVQEYSRESVLRFISNPALKEEVLGREAKEVRALCELICQEAFIVKGKEEWAERLGEYLTNLKKPAKEQGSGDEGKASKEFLDRKIRAGERILEIVEGLGSGLAELKGIKSFKGLAERAWRVGERFIDFENERWSWEAVEGEKKIDLRQTLEEVLEEISELDEVGVQADYEIFYQLLERGLAQKTIKNGDFLQGGVCITELMKARGVCFKAVFVPGLSEGNFPLSIGESPLLGDDDRERINQILDDAHLPGYLAEKWRQSQEERLLFYLICHQARDYLVLTSSWLDLFSNREKLPSYFLIYSLSQLTGREIEFDKCRELKEDWIRWLELTDFTPKDEELSLDQEEFENFKIEKEKDFSGFTHLLEQEGINRLVNLIKERWFGDQLGIYTGYLGAEENYQKLGLSIIGKEVSPSQLREFLSCPFRYFMARILGVEEVEKPERVWSFPRLGQGTLLHKALEKIFEKLDTQKKINQINKFKELLERFMKEEGRDLLREFYMPELLGELEIKELSDYLLQWYEELLPEKEYTRWEVEKLIPGPEVKFELDGERLVYFKGRIDRLDRAKGKACITDYKVSKSKDDALSQIQLPIYLFSVHNLLGFSKENLEARFFKAVPEKLARPEVKKISGRDFDNHLEKLRALVSAMVEGIEKGIYTPVSPKNVCGYCSYISACYAKSVEYEKKLENPLIRAIKKLVEETKFNFEKGKSDEQR